jgi:hypothetical protein
MSYRDLGHFRQRRKSGSTRPVTFVKGGPPTCTTPHAMSLTA